jgi:hypothetical protein
MRPPTRPSNSFYHPLDAMLGTPAGVRILRVLCLHQDVMSPAMIADRAGLGAVGANRALKRLMAARAIEIVGDLRRPQYRLARESQLIAGVRTLFEAEAERTDGFIRRLRKAARNLDPRPEAIWLTGSAAGRDGSVPSKLAVMTVWSGAARPGLKAFNQAMDYAATELALNAAIVTLSLAEVRQHAVAADEWWQDLIADAVPLLGPAPQNLIGG